MACPLTPPTALDLNRSRLASWSSDAAVGGKETGSDCVGEKSVSKKITRADCEAIARMTDVSFAVCNK